MTDPRTHPDGEPYRAELAAHCYRMLGCGSEAQDAVQETMLRAWQHRATYDPNRAALRTWLYTIATRVCLDMLRSTQRRARAVDLSPASQPGAALGPALPAATWVLPVPDSLVIAEGNDPADVVVARDQVRLALVAALQLLPPRQRAVLLLRDVLGFSAPEVSAQLGCSRAAVASALQRARRTMRHADVRGEPLRPNDATQARLLAEYCAAFERNDVDALVSLLHTDATFAMPPYAWWLHGRSHIAAALRAPDAYCTGARLVPTAANGSPAFWQTRPTGPGGRHDPFALVVLDIAENTVHGVTTFLDLVALTPLFDPPMTSAGLRRITS